MIKCLIVDDEPLARRLILSYVEQVPQLHCVGTCNTAIEAFALLQDSEVDVIFLDIEMPGITGLKLVQSLKVLPRIIFITAYAQHAADAFELEAVDYLVKPVTFERFSKAVNKLLPKGQHPNVEQLPVPEESHIFLKADRRLVKIAYHEICYIEALGDYLKIHRPDEPLIVYMTLSKLETLLPASRFIRIHRSTIVNMAYIRFIEGNFMQVNQTMLSIGQTYREGVRKRLAG